MYNSGYSIHKFGNINPRSILNLIAKLLGLWLLIELTITISQANWFENNLDLAIFLITFSTSIFLAIHIIYYSIGFFGLISYFNQRRGRNFINEISPKIILQEDELYFTKDTILITKSSNELTIAYDKTKTVIESIHGFLIIAWMGFMTSIFLYIGIFIGILKVNLFFFSLDILVIIEILWLFSEFIYPGNNLIRPLISGIRLSNENSRIIIDLKNNSFKLISKTIAKQMPEGEIVMDISKLENAMVKPVNSISSDNYIITIPFTDLDIDNSLEKYLKDEANNFIIFIIPEKALALQIQTILHSISQKEK